MSDATKPVPAHRLETVSPPGRPVPLRRTSRVRVGRAGWSR
jgi:hypothetical protein